MLSPAVTSPAQSRLPMTRKYRRDPFGARTNTFAVHAEIAALAMTKVTGGDNFRSIVITVQIYFCSNSGCFLHRSFSDNAIACGNNLN